MLQQTLENPSALSEQVQSLLSHMDSQEASMLALKSLLIDVANLPKAEADRRKFRRRIEAASDLCRSLQDDSALIIETLSKSCGKTPDTFSVRHLIAIFDKDDPQVAQAIRQARRRLLRLTWQISRISANTAWILSEDQNIRSISLEEKSGTSDSQRYDASGRKQLSPDSVRYGARS